MTSPHSRDLRAEGLTRLLQSLTELSEELLGQGRGALDADTDFAELGFDSAQLINYCNLVSERCGFEVSPALFFEYTTLRTLAEHLVQEYQAHRTDAPANGAAARPAEREAVAIIGMSCRFPMANSIDEYWDNLVSGRDCITSAPTDRWSAHETKQVPSGGFLDSLAQFDPLFFGISPHEAFLMDPTQRLLIMEGWRALEDAGYRAATLSGTSTGVFIGIGSSGYHSLLRATNRPIDGHWAMGAAPSMGPNRLSFFLNIHGPSEAIDTACSSSLVALHRAALAIRTGECEVALAGGVNVLGVPDLFVGFGSAGMLNEDGRCRPFSAHANGYVRSEGVGIVVLKALRAAERDGDCIHAVIRGSAENHGGRATSLTAPNPKAQAALLKAAYADAAVDPSTVGYIEAHGTGTLIGDPIEVDALKRAFNDGGADSGASRARPRRGIGSVKGNIGHLELASGVAGVIKAVLQIRNRMLVKSLHCEEPNPYIDFTRSSFFVVGKNQRWVALDDDNGRQLPLRAGVSSFGIGGTNAHVIIEEYIPRQPARETARSGEPFVVPLSTRSEEQLRVMASNLRAALVTHRFMDEDLPAIAYTLQVGREAFAHRMAVCACSIAELVENLDRWSRGEKLDSPRLARLERDLLEQWLAGRAVDWSQLYPAGHPRPVSLPTYPFLRERFWPEPAERSEPARPAESSRALVLAPAWEALELNLEERLDPRRAPAELLIVGEQNRHRIEEVATRVAAGTVRDVIWIAPSGSGGESPLEDIVPAQQEGVVALFRLLKAVLERGGGERRLTWTTVTSHAYATDDRESVHPAHAGVHGLAGAIAKENPKWQVRSVDLERADDLPLQEILALPSDQRPQPLARRGGVWYRRKLVPLSQQAGSEPPYRNGGVYVVVGGAGKVAQHWSAHVIRNYRAQVIWIGRRPADHDIEAAIERLAALGPRPRYMRADAAELRSLENCFETIRREYGQIHGLVNSATYYSIESIGSLPEEHLQAALSSSVDVTVRLAQASASDKLDFSLVFSSLISFMSNPRQGHYAAGCVFKDAFARFLASKVSYPVKVVNWGYWQSDSPDHFSRLNELGIDVIDPQKAMKALDEHLRTPVQQIGFMQTSRDIPLESVDFAGRSATPRLRALEEGGASAGNGSGVDAIAAVEGVVAAGVARLLGVEPSSLRADTDLLDLGFDSIMMVQYSNAIEQACDVELPATIFFEHRNVRSFCNFMVGTYGAGVASALASAGVARGRG